MTDHCSPGSETATLREFKKDIARHFEEVVKAIEGTHAVHCGVFKIERDAWGVRMSISAAELLVETFNAPAQAAPHRNPVFLELAILLAAEPIADDVVTISLTPMQRDAIVKALQATQPQCTCGRPLECPECMSLRTEPQAAQIVAWRWRLKGNTDWWVGEKDPRPLPGNGDWEIEPLGFIQPQAANRDALSLIQALVLTNRTHGVLDQIQKICDEALAAPPQEVIPTDEDHPDCVTARERELYDALMLLAGACMNHSYKSYRNWMQGGIKVHPVVAKALRLYEHSLSEEEKRDRARALAKARSLPSRSV